MPGHDSPHDAFLELFGDDSDVLAATAEDVTVLVNQPAPVPSSELAMVLMKGLSTEKGDLPATAASNVTGPAPQAAGLPKWRKDRKMLPVGFLSGLGAKVAAGAAASLVGITATGVAGALPGPAQGAVAGVVKAVTPFTIPDGSDGHAGGGAGAQVQALGQHAGVNVEGSAGAGTEAAGAGAQASVGVPGGGVSASAGAGTPTPAAGDASAAGQVSAGLPNLPSVGSLPGLGTLPGLGDLPVPACVTDLLDPATGQPLNLPTQITGDVVDCVRTLVDGLPLPANVDQCVTKVLDYVSTVVDQGGVPTGLPGFDVSSCVPFDITQCMSSLFTSLPGLGGAIPDLGGFPMPFGGGIPGFGGGLPIPTLPDLDGCMPFNLDACLSSILASVPGLATGTLPTGVPNIDLSNCVPA